MARSLRSKRRRKNKQVMRQKLKPKYDAQLASIVQNLQEETGGLSMETGTPIDISEHIQILDENGKVVNMDMEEDGKKVEKVEKPKIKVPKVDVNKLTKFMSQRKLRTFKAKQKVDTKRKKLGQKKKKDFKW